MRSSDSYEKKWALCINGPNRGEMHRADARTIDVKQNGVTVTYIRRYSPRNIIYYEVEKVTAS